MAKQTKPAREIIETHRPKKIDKYKFIIKDPDFYDELKNDSSFDMETLDMLKMDDVLEVGMLSTNDSFTRDIVSKSDRPTLVDEKRNLYVSKSMITKADKKLQSIETGVFTYHDNSYMIVKFIYEKFDIVELFLTVE